MYHVHRYSVRRFLTWEVYRSPAASKTRMQTTYSSWGRTDFLDYPDLGYTDGGCTIRKGWIFCPSKSHFTFYNYKFITIIIFVTVSKMYSYWHYITVKSLNTKHCRLNFVRYLEMSAIKRANTMSTHVAVPKISSVIWRYPLLRGAS